MKRVLFEDALIYSFLRLLQAVANALPERAALGAARAAGLLYYALGAKRRRIAKQNLRAAFGSSKSPAEIRRIIRLNYQHLMMNAVELLRASKINAAYVDKNVTVEGEEILKRHAAAGRGAILLSGHFGNWELLNLVGGVKKYPMYAFARLQKHPRSDAFLNRLRESQGARVIYKGVSARQLVRILREGKFAGVLADQDAGRHGVLAPFFGRLASWPRGVIRFARRTSSAVIPIVNIREPGGRHRIVLGSELPILDKKTDEESEAASMAEFARQLEQWIRRYPEQWLWPHRRWKTTPDRRCVILSDGKKGHLRQSLAVYQAIAKQRDESGIDPELTRCDVIDVRYRTPGAKKALSIIGFLTGGRFPFGMRLLKAALEPDAWLEIASIYADYVISCGSANEAVNLILARENGARSCLIHKPQFGYGHYDAVLVPRHDTPPSRRNVFATRGALAAEDEEEADLKNAFLKKLAPSGKLRIGFLVGGARRGEWDADGIARAAEALKGWAQAEGRELFVTTSRRTPPETEKRIKEIFGTSPACRLLVIANEENPPGAYAAILASADLLVVTADSVSMVSEAFATGRPVVALSSSKEGPDKKIASFLKDVESTGRVVLASGEGIAEAARGVLERAGQNIEADAAVDRAASALIGVK